MKKSIIALCTALLLLFSCKSKQAVTGGQAAENKKPRNEIVENHLANFKDFNTLLIKSNVSYKDKHTSQNLMAEVRIKKDEIILISVRFLGITMAKARITPNEVSYYEKLNNTYFKGDYAILSRWLGTKLDYQTVQDILLARAGIDDDGTYKSGLENEQYKLLSAAGGLTKEYLFEGGSYLLKRERFIRQANPPQTLDIQYPSHIKEEGYIVPSEIKIDAEQDDRVKINVKYTSVKFNESLTYPYDVPEGYNQIFIE